MTNLLVLTIHINSSAPPNDDISATSIPLAPNIPWSPPTNIINTPRATAEVRIGDLSFLTNAIENATSNVM